MDPRIDQTDTAAGTAAVYTCPMHPEVKSDKPGRCPKCGMFLVPGEKGAGGGHEHGGHVHSGRDRAAHGHHAHGHREGSAASLAGGKYDTVPAGWTGAVYTCPMHPEVRQTEAGACPLWGMGLQLVAGSAADEGANPELVDFELGSRKEVRWQGIRQRVVAIAETRFALSQADHVPSGGVTP